MVGSGATIPPPATGSAHARAGDTGLTLRPLRAEDAPAIQRRLPRWEIVRHLAATVPWPYPADGAFAHLEQCLAEMERGEKSHWAIAVKDADDLIGRIDLWPDDGAVPLCRRRRRPHGVVPEPRGLAGAARSWRAVALRSQAPWERRRGLRDLFTSRHL